MSSSGERSEWLARLRGKREVRVRVKPRGKKAAILSYDEEGDRFTISVRAAPEAGRANAELEAYLGRLLDAEVRVTRGKKSPRKTLSVRARTPPLHH